HGQRQEPLRRPVVGDDGLRLDPASERGRGLQRHGQGQLRWRRLRLLISAYLIWRLPDLALTVRARRVQGGRSQRLRPPPAFVVPNGPGFRPLSAPRQLLTSRLRKPKPSR